MTQQLIEADRFCADEARSHKLAAILPTDQKNKVLAALLNSLRFQKKTDDQCN